MTDIFDEVDQELKQEKLIKLTKKYAPYFIALLCVVIFGIAVTVFWQNKQIVKQEKMGDIFDKALLALNKGETSVAMESFDYLIKEGKGGFAMLAKFQKAALLMSQNKSDEAITLYEEIAKDKSVDASLKNLSRLIVLSYLVDNKKISESEIVGRLEEIYKNGMEAPFAPLAKLIETSWYLRPEQKEKLNKTLQELEQSKNLPEGIIYITEEIRNKTSE